jgi:hypothetical protein
VDAVGFAVVAGVDSTKGFAGKPGAASNGDRPSLCLILSLSV